MKRRENGFGTLISKGENKPWLAKWKYNGKTYYKTTGEIDKKKALKALEIFTKPFREDNQLDVILNLKAKVEGIKEQKRINDLKKSGILISDLENQIDLLLEFKQITQSTKNLYKGFIKKFNDWLVVNKPACNEMKFVSESIAKEYFCHISDEISISSYNQRLVLFKRLFEMLKKEGHYENNPFKNIKKLKLEASNKRAFTTEELFNILNHIKDDSNMIALFSLGIYSGLRLSDCCNLKWGNVDLIKRVITVIPIKVKRFIKKPIVIPIHNSLYNILLQLRENKGDSEYVLPECKKSYDTKYLKNKILKIFQDCGIKTYEMVDGKKKFLVGFHSVRHTFISLNINGGMNPMLVQNIVGHSSVDMTRNYFHQNENVLRDGINKMPDLLGCSDYVDMTIKDDDLELLKSMFDKEQDKSLSDTIKRLVDYYKNIINV